MGRRLLLNRFEKHFIPSLYLILFLVVFLSCSKRDTLRGISQRGDLLLFETFDASSEERVSIKTLLYDGNAVLLYFWGIRCIPCIEEIKELNRLYQEELHGRGVEFIAINTDELGRNELKNAMKEHGIDILFPVVADPELTITDFYSDGFIPHNVIITPDSVMALVITGYNRENFFKVKEKLMELAKGK